MATSKANGFRSCRHPRCTQTGRGVLILLCLAVAGCATMPRAPAGTCLQRTVDALDLGGLPDGRKHCVASAAIARQCGRGTAWLAGFAKELSDLLGRGDFERRDLEADRAGRACAATTQDGASRTMGQAAAGRPATDQPMLENCCVAAGY